MKKGPPFTYPTATYQAAADMRNAGSTWEQIGAKLLVPEHFRQSLKAWLRWNEKAAS